MDKSYAFAFSKHTQGYSNGVINRIKSVLITLTYYTYYNAGHSVTTYVALSPCKWIYDPFM